MFIVILRYIVSLEEVERYLEAHRAFLQKYYDEGRFILSGPRIPREGGIIIMAASVRGRVDQIMSEDPFIQNGIATYDVIPFVPVRFHPLLEQVIEKYAEKPVEVVPYSPGWPAQFEQFAAELHEIYGDNLVELHHIGSTSVPGLSAKPVIDIISVVRNLDAVDAVNAKFEEKGYQVKGELGAICQRLFVKDDENGKRIANIHTWTEGSPQIERHLIFRDYLRAHPDVAEEYAQLKLRLAQEYPTAREGYTGGKSQWVEDVIQRAMKCF